MSGKFSNYRKIVEKADAFSKKVLEKYPDDIVCKKGCASCCEKVLTFFPVEFFYIVKYINRNNVDIRAIQDNVKKINNNIYKACPFLKDNGCLIYDARPVICRTFGLPAIMVDHEEETIEYQVCEKNFKDKSISIDKQYVININTLNGMLYVINSAFVNLDDWHEDVRDRFSVLDIIDYI